MILSRRYYLNTPIHFLDRPLKILQESISSTDSARLDPDSIANTVAQLYPNLSEVFDHPLNDKTLLKLIPLLPNINPKLNYFFGCSTRHSFFQRSNKIQTVILNLHPVLKLPLLQKLKKIFLKLKMSMTNHLNFKKMFDLIKQIGDRIEQYRANISDLLDFESLKDVPHGYGAAYFSSVSLQMNQNEIQCSSSELQSAVTKLNHNFTFFLLSNLWDFFFEIFPHIIHQKIYCSFYDF